VGITVLTFVLIKIQTINATFCRIDRVERIKEAQTRHAQYEAISSVMHVMVGVFIGVGVALEL
jgi:hypothetical protein